MVLTIGDRTFLPTAGKKLKSTVGERFFVTWSIVRNEKVKKSSVLLVLLNLVIGRSASDIKLYGIVICSAGADTRNDNGWSLFLFISAKSLSHKNSRLLESVVSLAKMRA